METSECAGKNSSIRIFWARSYNFFSKMQREVRKTSFLKLAAQRAIFLITFLIHKNLVGFYITICKRYCLGKKHVSMGLLKIIWISLPFFSFLLKFQKVPVLNLNGWKFTANHMYQGISLKVPLVRSLAKKKGVRSAKIFFPNKVNII